MSDQPDQPTGPTGDGSGRPGEPASSGSDLIARAREEARRVLGDRSDPFRGRPAPPPPDAVPGYLIEREIHRGGQGVVYLAVQQTTGRRVAIKVLHDGPFADAREVLRFEREMQILSRLEHPNIVRIIDRGVAHGQHWFAMDYVSGPTLDRWLTDGERSRTEVLTVFRKICSAVQAAHVQGVVHRDLKPSNIRLDETGEPHVLDFGLARASPTSDDRERTVTGEFVGTPAWTSPEQIARDPSRIDQRTDVYLLGLILFKLLTGRNPSDIAAHRAELIEALRRVPPPPSSISREVDDELDTIVGTCLAAEQDRRYQSVHALGEDIERYIKGEPIEAKRDSRWYLMAKFARRYRSLLTAAAIAVAAVTALSIFSTVQWVRAERAAAGEREAWRRTEQALVEKSAADLAAQRNAAMFDAASELFIDEVVESADIVEGGDDDVRIADVLSRGAQRIGKLFTDPATQAEFHARFGRTFKSLRQWEPAIENLEAAVSLARRTGAPPEVQAALLEDLGFALTRAGRSASALPVQEEGLALRRAAASGPSVPVAKSLLGVASALHGMNEHDRAVEADRQAIDMLAALQATPAPAAAPGSPTGPSAALELARAKASLSLHLRRLSEKPANAARRAELLAEAVRLCEEVVAAYEADPSRGPAHSVTLQARNNQAMCLREAGRMAEALDVWRATIEVWRDRHPGHPSAATPLFNLAGTLANQLDLPREALPYALEVLEIRRRTASPTSSELARALTLAALCHAESALVDAPAGAAAQPRGAGATGQLAQRVATVRAIALLDEAMQIHGRQPGGGSPATTRALLAICQIRAGDPQQREAALAALQAAKAELDRDLPEDSPPRRRVSRWLREAEGG